MLASKKRTWKKEDVNLVMYYFLKIFKIYNQNVPVSLNKKVYNNDNNLSKKFSHKMIITMILKKMLQV